MTGSYIFQTVTCNQNRPLIRLWTLRFESKHSSFKRCARKLQNFVNLPKTLAERHQILQAYYNAGSLFTDLDAAIPFDQSPYNDDIQKATRDFNLGGGRVQYTGPWSDRPI